MACTRPDRRAESRQRRLLGARIGSTLHPSDTDCVVRDAGPEGFRIAVASSVPLPRTFDLRIAKTGETRRVTLVWRSGDQAGVSYAREPAAAAPIPLDLMRDLRAARQEIAALRARLTEGG